MADRGAAKFNPDNMWNGQMALVLSDKPGSKGIEILEDREFRQRRLDANLAEGP